MKNYFRLLLNIPARVRTTLILVLIFVLIASFSYGQPTWTRVPSPNPSTVRNLLRGISGTSSSDIWTVGHYYPNPSTITMNNLVMHWNGTGWQTMTVPNPSTNSNDLWDVAAINTNLAWAVGDFAYSNGVANALILKWDGSTWAQQSIPLIAGGSFLFGLGVINSNDIWAVGGKAGSPFLCYSMHYNGSSWTEVPVPPAPGSGRNDFNGVHGISSNDVWAVGSWGVAVGDYHFLAMHWNGSAWVNSPIPTSVNGAIDGELMDVKVVSSNDVWAVGYSLAGGVVLIHYDGTSWTQVPTSGGGGALAVLSANDIYGVGGDITHWNGSSWTVTDTLISYPWPALNATTVLPNGEIWAAGRTVDSNNVFQTLVYRRGPGSTTTTGVNIHSASLHLGVYPNPFDNVITLDIATAKGQPADIMLTDMTGRTVLQNRVTLSAGSNHIPLNVPAAISAGMYMVEIKSGGEVQKVKVAKN